METFTVSFFGHRQLSQISSIEARLEEVVRQLLLEKEYVEFLVGRNGEFDQLVSSGIRRAKGSLRDDNSALILVLPYPTAEYLHNTASFQAYYDEVELCQSSAAAHFKAAIQIRNRAMVDRSDLAVFCVAHASGGAYQTLRYAARQGKRILNLGSL